MAYGDSITEGFVQVCRRRAASGDALVVASRVSRAGVRTVRPLRTAYPLKLQELAARGNGRADHCGGQ